MSTQKTKNTPVSQLMLPLEKFPVVETKTILKEALEEMGNARLGIVCIINEEKRLEGILTDGDIRRKLLKVQKPFSAFFIDDALDHAIKTPMTISPDTTLIEATLLMGDKQVWDLPVVDAEGKLVGLLHLHPVVQALLQD